MTTVLPANSDCLATYTSSTTNSYTIFYDANSKQFYLLSITGLDISTAGTYTLT